MTELNFCSGWGQYHSPSNPVNPQEYSEITPSEILAMADKPDKVPKESARWFLPSTLKSRVHSEQRKSGQFGALVAESDNCEGLSFSSISARLAAALPFDFLLYTSRSATEDNPKFRVIAFLEQLVPGADYPLFAKCLNDRLEIAGLVPDRVTERCGQVAYLPNAGEFYDFAIIDDRGMLSPQVWQQEVDAERSRLAGIESERLEKREINRKKAFERMKAGSLTPVEAYNQSHQIELELERYGYVRRGKKWISPNSSSGVPGVTITDDKWYSMHASDSEIGKRTDSGTMGDTFDLYAYYEHEGNYQKAVRAAGKMFATRQEDCKVSATNPENHQQNECKSLPTPSWAAPPFLLDQTPDLSHDARALALSEAGFNSEARYVARWATWLFWDGGRWQRDERLFNYTAIREYMRSTSKRLLEWADAKAALMENRKEATLFLKWARREAKSLRQAGNIAAVESLARSNPDLVASVDQFDANPMLLGTPGGTIDLTTGKLRKARRDDWITKSCAVTPAPEKTEAPLWNKFLDRIFASDAELISFMQRVFGYALTGSTNEQKLVFCYGTGSNGKSVCLNTPFDIMGEYAKRAPAVMLLDSGGERHPTDLAGLHGARLVAGSELPAGKAWNESIIKDLTGGDVITARFMRQDYFEFKPQFTLIIAGNHMPSFRGIDEAIRRRVVLVPFTQTIPPEERDPKLPEKLKREWPAILRWMVEGALEWQKVGLSVPATVQAASADYLDSEDMLGEFIEDHLVQGPGNVSTAEVYERFCRWQRSSGMTQPWSQKGMTQALRERGFAYGKLTGGVRGFRGVGLKKIERSGFDDTGFSLTGDDQWPESYQ